LILLGWRLLDQDRALQSQRTAEIRENAADQVVAALQRALQTSQGDLAQFRAPTPPDDSLMVEFGSSAIRVQPIHSLLFYPSPLVPREAPSSIFLEAETYEFQRQDYEKAASALTGLTRSPDASIRAGAYLRIARVQRKAGRVDSALRTYAELARLDDAAVGGLPAGLVARRARCVLLDQLGRSSDLAKEAAGLYDLLRRGGWQLSQSVYEVHAEEAAAWLSIDRRAEAGPVALAEAVIWLSGQKSLEPRESGRTCILRQGRLVTIIWARGSEGLRALAAGPTYLERTWLAPLTPLKNKLRVGVAIKEMNPSIAAATERAPSATELPWTVQVGNTDVQGEIEEFASRRRLLLGALGLLMVVIGAGSYSVARAFTRELAVARLQSDFVSAVSHEFRTPLTSLRQLSEALNEDRPLADERRTKYYQALDRATHRLHQLVEGLLNFGRMESGAMVYRKTDLDVKSLIAAIVEEFERESGDHGYHIELKTPASLPAVCADPEALGRAFWNLLDNAAKYSPECNTIRVEVEPQGSNIAIRVRDRGVGIAPAEHRKILRKFVRGTAAQSLGVRGTGIGLVMVKHIVDAHAARFCWRVNRARGAHSAYCCRQGGEPWLESW